MSTLDHTGGGSVDPSPDATRTRTRTRTRLAVRECGVTTASSGTRPKSDAELYGLLAEYAADELAPADLELGPLPSNATDDMRLVAADMRLLMALRLAAGDDRPLPYSARFSAQRMCWRDPKRANRAINKLCNAKVICFAGPLTPRGQPRGTGTYAPPSGAGAFEGESVSVEGLDRPAVEPAGEIEDQAAVRDAEPASGVGGTAASGNRADGTDHESDVSGVTGDFTADQRGVSR